MTSKFLVERSWDNSGVGSTIASHRDRPLDPLPNEKSDAGQAMILGTLEGMHR
jgi:hypothetical protein